ENATGPDRPRPGRVKPDDWFSWLPPLAAHLLGSHFSSCLIPVRPILESLRGFRAQKAPQLRRYPNPPREFENVERLANSEPAPGEAGKPTPALPAALGFPGTAPGNPFSRPGPGPDRRRPRGGVLAGVRPWQAIVFLS